MEKEKFYKIRRLLALMMAAVMVLANSNLAMVVYGAEGEPQEEPVTAVYTFVCMVDQAQQKLSGAQVVIRDQAGLELAPDKGAYTLETGKIYQYEVSGERFETVTTGTVTAEDAAQEYVIRIPLDNLKYAMKDTTCFEGGTVSMQDEWLFDWVWTSSDPAVATVGEDGTVTGIKPGTATITREYSTLHQEAVVTVEEKPISCKLSYLCGESQAPADVKVEVQRGGKTVQPDADGIYQLLPAAEYTYTVKTKGIQTTDHQGKGSFQAPAYTDKTETVKLALEYTEPVFEIDGKQWGTVERIRKGQMVSLRCVNFNDLYASETLFWEYQAAGQDKQKLTAESFGVVCQEPFRIDCSIGAIGKGYQKETFETYQLSASYAGKYAVSGASYFVNGKEIREEDLEPGKEYSILVRAKGFEDRVNTIVTSASEVNISLEAGALKQPVITVPEENVLSGYVGTTLKISQVTVSEHAEGPDWGWYCVKESDASQRLEVSEKDGDLTILLQGSAGTYQLFYGCEEVVSNAAAISIMRVPVEIDWKLLPGKQKIYDATPDFEFQLPVKSDAVVFKEADKKDFDIKEEDCLTVKGKVSSAETGSYQSFTVTEVFDASNRYELSGIGKKTEELAEPFEIRQAVLTVDFHNVSMSYRTNAIGDPSAIEFLNADGVDELVKQDIFNRMGNAQNVTYMEQEQKASCTFSNVQYDEEQKRAYIGKETDNVRFDFSGLQEFEGKNILFTVKLVPETLAVSEAELEQMLNIKQGDAEGTLRNESWCSSAPITAEMAAGTEYCGDMAYSTVLFRKSSQGAEEQEASASIEADGTSEEVYYEILLSKAEASWPYTCRAGFVHIIAEEYLERADRSLTVDVSGRTYPVLNLYLDTSAPKVRFVEPMQPEDGTIMLDGRKIKDIRFTLENSGFPVTGLEYVFMNQTGSLADGQVMDNKVIKDCIDSGLSGSMTKLELTGDEKETYIVNCPDVEGDYVLVVRAANSAGLQGYYCSQGFAVDLTAPEIDARLIENQKDVTAELQEQPYRSQPAVLKIDLKEMHIQDVQIEVKASNRKGDILFTTDAGQYEQQLKKLEYDSRGGKSSCQIPFAADANYEISIRAKDKAGYETIKTFQFTMDRSVPDKGKIKIEGTAGALQGSSTGEKGVMNTVRSVFKKSFEKLYSKIKYQIFGDDTIKYTLSGSDEISPVQISYFISAMELDEAGLIALQEENWLKWENGEEKSIVVNTKCIIYERVRDLAGNCSYFSTEGMITDNHKPEITVTWGEGINANGFYKGDVTFSAKVEDVIPKDAAVCSGLQYVSYYLKKDGSYQNGEVLLERTGEDTSGTTVYEISKRTIPAETFNSNAVVLCVTAVDQAGNRIVEEKEIKIDNVKPQIQVTYDDQPGARYYNKARTATIRIRERNLDRKDIKIKAQGAEGGQAQISDWSHTGEEGESDDTVYICRVTFSRDDQYTFTVDCTDEAGNRAERSFSDQFILDATAPVLTVSYSGGQPEKNAYYRTGVTATIRITEHNFDAAKVDIKVRADKGTAPAATGFHSDGDVHTATVTWNTDGIYGLDVSYTDEAGNAAESHKGNTFTVDLMEPVIVIEGVEDLSANRDEVKPVITCQDENYAGDQVQLRLQGANHGEMKLDRFVVGTEDVENGQLFRLDFPKEQDVDDIYTLTAEITDKAGNHSEKSIEFSINRFGSVYTLGTETAGWLKNGECAFLKEAQPVVIIETNVDEITERNIAFTEGGVNASVIKVKEFSECSQEEKERGSYYEVKKTGKAGKWHQYEYTIAKDNFLTEGRYSIQIDSTDQAGNHTSNVSNRHTDGNLGMEFAVDQTAPSAVVTGAQNGALYNEISHMLYLDVQDNLGLEEVTVFLNGVPSETYTAEKLAELENGVIPLKVDQSVNRQTVRVMAKDLAGNVLGGSGGGPYDKSFGEFELFVTTNFWVRLLHTTWMWVTVLVVAGLATAAVILLSRRKGNTEIGG